MAHIPINHQLRQFYRTLAGLCGCYILIFGIVAVGQTGGRGMFSHGDLPTVLGLRANRGFAVLSILAGCVIVVGALIGRNLDHFINLVGGIGFLTVGILMLALIQTDLNLLGFTVTTCVISFVIGTVLFTAGLYGKSGTAEDVSKEEAYRHGQGAQNLTNNGMSP